MATNISAFLAMLSRKANSFPHVFYSLLLFEVFVCMLIVFKVPYTEIDWVAYMQEVDGFLNGTLNYSMLKGDTGPLVYPSGFVFLFSGLYWATDHGTNIRLAQCIFALLYISNWVVICRLYKKAKVPAFLMISLTFLSYRVHSIFMLRLFNDCFCVFFVHSSMLALVNHRYTLSALIFSLGLSIKMNALLFLPGFLVVLVSCGGIILAIKYLMVIVTTQVMIALPFLYYAPWEYLGKAFELNRVFFYKWTVNWRFIGERLFLHSKFHAFLLVTHLSLLVLFGWCKWRPKVIRLTDILRPSFKGVFPPMDVAQVLSTVWECNLIGILCSRSLHYQFYSWYYYSIPFLLHSSCRLNYALLLVVVVCIEYCWIVYPSTKLSSFLLLMSHLFMLARSWTKPLTSFQQGFRPKLS